MNRRHPPPGTPPGLAPHIPADLYHQAQHEGRPIVIVQPGPPPARRSAGVYLAPIAVVFAGVVGLLGTVAAILALLDFAARTAVLVAGAAGPIGVGGITLRLFHTKTK